MLNGSIIEYEDYGSIVGLDVIRLSGGGVDWPGLLPSIDVQRQTYQQLVNQARYEEGLYDLQVKTERRDAEERRQDLIGTGVMATVAHAALRRKHVKRPLPGSNESHPFRKNKKLDDIFNKPMSNLRLTTYYGPMTMEDTQNGGPGIQVGTDKVRFLAAQTMSTYSTYKATSWATGDFGSNEFRRIGYGQPLYMEIATPFENCPNCPLLPLTTANPQSMESMEGICFNLQWPGQRMHEDPVTNQVMNTALYSVWSQITSSNFDKTVNVDFSKVLENPYWRKMIIGNVHLRMEFHNHSAHDHMIHIIWYTNKRKGIAYANEFTQWIQSLENNTDSNRIIASDFYQKGIFQMKPPCKILRHKKFILRAAKPNMQWDSASNYNGFGSASMAYLGGGNRKVIKMKSTSGYTLKRDTLKTLTPQLDEDTWLESTNVEEERMIFCQIIAAPIRRRVRMVYQKLYGPAQQYDYTLNESKIDITEVPGTNMQYTDEVYGSHGDGKDPEGYIPIPGIEVDIRRKVYFKVDKEIELS